jgi:UDP-2-acetamido-3-amino-2,3-dideoxy-glucuronate N-acetyltransferase
LKNFFLHPTAIIDKSVRIGNGTKVWHFCHILEGAKIGCNCVLGQNVMIGKGVRIGDRCKIQNNVSIYEGVELEDDVFCGPSMVFTNVKYPRAFISRKGNFEKTFIKRCVTLGANSTIICGSTIGQYAFIAAGAVVGGVVPDFAFYAGVPAKQKGWACICGKIVREKNFENILCPDCNRQYRIDKQTLILLSDDKI